jgi:acylpyruvate hydrolase
MRLVRFSHEGAVRLGALAGDQAVVDLQRADPSLPADMIPFLAGGAAVLARASQVVRAQPAAATLPLASVQLLAPLARPGKIICIGLNYRDHAAESHAEVPEYPTVFAKFANTVIGPGEPIVLPRVSSQVDYEGELGVVIGRRVRDVPEAEALACVGGYLPFNDVSARDYQHRTSQWTVGKTFDTFAPLGPALVTADEVGEPQRLGLRVTIGDEVLQDSNTGSMIFTVAHLITYLSTIMTLEPGDLIATGTPSGVGAARTPQRFLRPGDRVRVAIERLGVLENPVVTEV